jgi:tetratricopeptide (TPR) repeat protein
MSQPATTEQLLQQGLFHHRQGDAVQAMERYVEVLRINPQNADALYYIAMIACQDGQFQQGADLARRAIAAGPPQARVYNLLGQALDRLGERLEALKNYDQAIALDANFADAHGNRANILAAAGMAQEALASFDRALALKPDSVADWVNRGVLLQELGRLEEALTSYDKALALIPNDAAILTNRGNVLSKLDRLEEAEVDYARAIALAPKSPLPHLHRGLALKYLGRFEQARAEFEQAMALDDKDHTAAFTLSQLLLLTGKWREAWPLLERRASLPEPLYQPLDFPRWNGERPGGYRLVLLSEQGLGDNIQFGRYASLLAGRGYPVTVLTRDVLAPLLRSLPSIEKVITSVEQLQGDIRPVRWLPLMSALPALHLTPDTIPAQEPYLSAEPARIAKWAQRLGAQGCKIGIAWKGTSWLSAAPLAAFAPLAEIPGVRLISLQKGAGLDQIGAVAFGGRIERMIGENDVGAEALLDSAAIMQNLDLVVSIDAMPAHLAGALERPVFLALRSVPEWRWLLDRADSPWYASMQLFRQGPDRDWAPVFEAIAKAVREKMASAAH